MKLEYFLRVYQSSSPSYVLMSSVDRCMSHINKKLFEIYYNNMKHFTEACKKLRYVNIYSPDVDKRKIFDFDCGKILIYSKYNYNLSQSSKVLGYSNMTQFKNKLEKWGYLK